MKPKSDEPVPFALAKKTFVRSYLVELLALAKGNRSLAARMAGMDPSNLRRLLRTHGLASPGPPRKPRTDPPSL